MKSLFVFVLIVFGLSALAVEDGRRIHLQMNVSVDGEELMTPQGIFRSGTTSRITATSFSGKQVIMDMALTEPGHKDSLMITLKIYGESESGELKPVSSPQILTMLGEESSLEIGHEDNSEFAMRVLAREVE